MGRHSIGLSRGIAYQHTIGWCATFTNRSLLEVVNRDTARGKLVLFYILVTECGCDQACGRVEFLGFSAGDKFISYSAGLVVSLYQFIIV